MQQTSSNASGKWVSSHSSVGRWMTCWRDSLQRGQSLGNRQNALFTQPVLEVEPWLPLTTRRRSIASLPYLCEELRLEEGVHDIIRLVATAIPNFCEHLVDVNRDAEGALRRLTKIRIRTLTSVGLGLVLTVQTKVVPQQALLWQEALLLVCIPIATTATQILAGRALLTLAALRVWLEDRPGLVQGAVLVLLAARGQSS
eukprot:scaffold1213_cov350-Prasinococcus_capsulatus_cf.AAC.8